MINNEIMQLHMQVSWWQVMNIPKNGTQNVAYRSKIEFMVFVWNSKVKTHKLNVNKIFTQLIYSQHLTIIQKIRDVFTITNIKL